MANFKPIRLTDAQLSSYPIREGQVLYTTDKTATYIDISNTSRIQITDINQITEDERIDMLVPVSGFYYTSDTHCFWYCDGFDWYPLSLSVDDIRPTYSDITNLTTLQSGESLPTAFAKIKLAITSLINHINDIANPHKTTKAQLGLAKVENKSSADIRGEITSENVTDALGYVPPEQDTTYSAATSTAMGLVKNGNDIYVDSTGKVSVVSGTASKLKTPVDIALSGAVLGSASFDGSASIEIVTDIESLDVDKLSGIIDISHLPKGALERCVDVIDDTARFALTKDQIQNGDTVRVGADDSAVMYFVVDDTKLNSEDGYKPYGAGHASSVPWAGVTGKPDSFYTHPTYTNHASGMYKITVDATGHVSAVSPITKEDIEALGISVELAPATETDLGGIKSGTDIVVDGEGNVTVAQAGKLKVGRKIGDAIFDGTADISLIEMGIKNPIEITKADYEALKSAGELNMEAYYNILDDYDSVTLIDDTAPAENQTYSSTKMENTFSKKSTIVETSLVAASWTGSSAPYSYSLTVNGVTANNINEMNYSSSATDDQIKSYQEAGLKDGGQSTNTLTILATTKKPTINIPVTIIVRHDS